MKYKVFVDPRVKIGFPELVLPNILQVKNEITEQTAMEFADNLINAQNSSQEIIPILIDTYGGDIYALMSMLDMIASIKDKKIATIIEGKAMSAGSVLFSAGHDGYRFMSESSTIMIHHTMEETSGGSINKIHDVQAGALELERVNTKMLEILSTNCGKPKDYFKKLLTKNNHADLYLDANACIKHNLANHIKIPTFDVSIDMKVSFG